MEIQFFSSSSQLADLKQTGSLGYGERITRKAKKLKPEILTGTSGKSFREIQKTRPRRFGDG